MEFATNHEKGSLQNDYSFRINEDLGDDAGMNSEEIGVYIPEFIDSRAELSVEIRKKALAFMRRAVEKLEKELEGK